MSPTCLPAVDLSRDPAQSGACPVGDAHTAIGSQALRALRDELLCYPKPGLVSPVDRGSRTNMDADLFLTSLNALRDYFPDIAAAGARGAAFDQLQSLGRNAERGMLVATGGVNTHRGAIFSLGLRAAAAGWQRVRSDTMAVHALGVTVRRHWGQAIIAATPSARHATSSHGSRVALRYGLGARGPRPPQDSPTCSTSDYRYCMPHCLKRRTGQGPDTHAAGRRPYPGRAIGGRVPQPGRRGGLGATTACVTTHKRVPETCLKHRRKRQ